MKNSIIFIFVWAYFFQSTFAQDSSTDNTTMVFVGHNSGVKSFDISKDGKTMVSVDNQGELIFWQLALPSPENKLKGHSDAANVVRFSDDDKYAFSGGNDRKILIWNVEKKELYKTIDRFPSNFALPKVTALAVSKNFLVTGHSDNNLYKWDIQDLNKIKLIATLGTHQWAVNDICILGQEVLSVGSENDIKRWLVERKSNDLYMKESYKEHFAPVQAITCSNDGKLLFSGGLDKLLIEHSIDGKVIKKWQDSTTINALCVSPDNQYLASGGADGIVRLWDLKTYNFFPLKAHSNSITALHFTPDGRYLLSASLDGTLRKWYIGDMMVKIYFVKEIEKECPKDPPRGEFETLAEYQERLRQSAKKREAVYAKYALKYEEMQKEIFNRNSRESIEQTFPVTMRIDTLSMYHPEAQDEYFDVVLTVNKTKNDNGKVYPTLRGRLKMGKEEAIKFKANNAYTRAIITAKATPYANSYKISSVSIKHPTTKKIYTLQEDTPKKE